VTVVPLGTVVLAGAKIVGESLSWMFTGGGGTGVGVAVGGTVVDVAVGATVGG
jgi:hypothetical protein